MFIIILPESIFSSIQPCSSPIPKAARSNLPSSSSSSSLSHHSHPLGEPRPPLSPALGSGRLPQQQMAAAGAGSLVTPPGHCLEPPPAPGSAVVCLMRPKGLGWAPRAPFGWQLHPGHARAFLDRTADPQRRERAFPTQQLSPHFSDGVCIGQGRAQSNPAPAAWEGVREQ